jgi:tetratricopeptide (TPR) repeat protein
MMKKSFSIAPVALIFCGLVFSAQKAAGSTAPAQTAAPAAKAAPQAQTKEEYKAYTEASTVTGGAAMEKAARRFSEKFPNSDLGVFLYSRALHEYQNENNPFKILEMARTVLRFDTENAIALVLTATVLSDSLSERDADRAKKAGEIREDCARAQKALASGATPAGADPQQVKAYQATLQSMIYSALGILELKLGNDAEAEKQLKAATLVQNIQPDAYVWYHLALALDHQKHYPQALAAVNEALRFTGSNAELQKLAAGERDRLAKLTPAGPGQPSPQPEPEKTPR